MLNYSNKTINLDSFENIEKEKEVTERYRQRVLSYHS